MLSGRKHPFFIAIVILTDTVMVLSSFIAAYWIRFSGLLLPIHKGIPSFHEYFRAMILILPIYLILFRSYRLYQPERHVRRIYELMSVAKATTLAMIFSMALTFVYREFSYSRIVLLIAWVLSVLLCSAGRYFLIQFEYYVRREKERDRLLIVGINRSARNLIEWTKNNPHYGQDVSGVISSGNGNEGKHLDGVPVLGTLFNINQVLTDVKIDEVIVADPSISKDIVTELMLKCESKMIRFKLVADFYGLVTHYVDVEYVSNVPLLGLKALPLDDPWNQLLKRAFDLVLSLFGLILLSPLFIVMSILIKLSSKGPIFYVQERIGRDEKPFRLYKFRTMVTHAEKESGPVWAKRNDSRVTSVGRFLRRTNIDELPQLWNVLIGEMSLVGPRPERPHFVQRFRDEIPRYMSRHKIKAGITGWAQIHGLRGNTSLEERIKYDLYYIENWTLILDVEILLATLFSYRNAY